MNPRSSAVLFPMLFSAVPLFAQGGDAVDLQLTAKKGSSVWLVRESKEEQVVEAMGQQFETQKKLTYTWQLTVKDVDDKGIATVETKIARIQGSLSDPEAGDVEFDSLEPQEEAAEGDIAPVVKSLQAGAGKTFGAKVDRNGRVVELLADAKALIESAKNLSDGHSLEESGLKQMVENAFGLRPEKPTATGGKWDYTRTERGGIQTKLELTLSKIEADSFEVSATGTLLKPKGGAEAADDDDPIMRNATFKKSKVGNTIRVSRQDGFVVESTHSAALTMETSHPEAGDIAIDVTFGSTTKRTTAEAAMAKKAATKPPETPKEAPKEPKQEEPKEQPK